MSLLDESMDTNKNLNSRRSGNLSLKSGKTRKYKEIIQQLQSKLEIMQLENLNL